MSTVLAVLVGFSFFIASVVLLIHGQKYNSGKVMLFATFLGAFSCIMFHFGTDDGATFFTAKIKD